MVRDNTVAVVGAGVIGAAVAYALTREGRAVLLLDRAEPGMTGPSFGNPGHIAAELVEPLPSWTSYSDSGANCLLSAARSKFRCAGRLSFCPGHALRGGRQASRGEHASTGAAC
jgi:glycine/D-amino acid oxidase-like deaminating enzyme